MYVDESGESGLHKTRSRRFLTLGFVYCDNPANLSFALRKYLQYAHRTNIYPTCLNELKFNLPICKLQKNYSQFQIGTFKTSITTIRNRVLDIINSYSDGIFIASLDKDTIVYATWKPERIYNYIFATTMIENVFTQIDPNENIDLLFDAGRLHAAKENDFLCYLLRKCSFYGNNELIEYYGSKWKFNSVQSHTEPCIWAADFVAGAALLNYSRGNSTFLSRIDRNKFLGDGIRNYW